MSPFSGHCGFVVKDRIAGANRDATERRDGFAIELLDAEEHVGFVHSLEVEVGSDDTVAVDDCSTHVGSDFWRVGGLDRRGGDWRSRQAVEGPD